MGSYYRPLIFKKKEHLSHFKQTEEGVLLQVKVIPNAKTNQIVGWERSHLKVKIAAPAEKGRANHVLIQILAKHFQLPQKDVLILKGETSRVKVILLCGKKI